MPRRNDGRVGRDKGAADGCTVLGRLPGSAREQGRVESETFVDDGVEVRQTRQGLEVCHVNVLQLFVDLVNVLRVLCQLAEDANQSGSSRFAAHVSY